MSQSSARVVTVDEHDTYNEKRVKRIGQRLKVIRDVPDIESYVQLEMRDPRKAIAVTGT